MDHATRNTNRTGAKLSSGYQPNCAVHTGGGWVHAHALCRYKMNNRSSYALGEGQSQFCPTLLLWRRGDYVNYVMLLHTTWLLLLFLSPHEKMKSRSQLPKRTPGVESLPSTLSAEVHMYATWGVCLLYFETSLSAEPPVVVCKIYFRNGEEKWSSVTRYNCCTLLYTHTAVDCCVELWKHLTLL